MPNAMTTVGQGGTSFIAVPLWSAASATEATGGYFLRLKFSVASLAAINHLIGSSASTAGSIRTLTDGALRYRNNTADLITSPVGAITPGQIHELRLRRLYTPLAAIELLLDGISVGTTTTTTLGFLTNVNQLARFSTTARSDVTVYEFEVFNGASSYSTVWDETGASGSGVSWLDDSATRNLTITNPVIVNDSWWVFYSTGSTYQVGGVSQFAVVPTAFSANIASAGAASGISLADQAAAALIAKSTGVSQVSLTVSGSGLLLAKASGVSSFDTDLDGVLIANRLVSGVSGFALSDSGKAINVAKVSGVSGFQFSVSATVKLTAAAFGNARFAIDASANAIVVGQVAVYTIGGVSSVQVASQAKPAAIMNAGGQSLFGIASQAAAASIYAVSGVSALPFTAGGRAINVASVFGTSGLAIDTDAAALIAFGVSGQSLAQLAASAHAALCFSGGGSMRFSIGATGKGVLTAYIDGNIYFNIRASGNVTVGDQPNFGMIRLPLIRAYSKVRTNSIKAKSVIRVSL